MLHPKDRPAAIQKFATAIGNISSELIEVGGVSHAALAAALRIEAGKVEVASPRRPMEASAREMVDLVRRVHDFINTLMVAGVGERVAETCILHAIIERIAAREGVDLAAAWLHHMGDYATKNAAMLGQTSQAR